MGKVRNYRKKDLYDTLISFTNSHINVKKFVDEIYSMYDIGELEGGQYSNKEIEIWNELSDYLHKFSPYEDEVENNPQIYIGENEIKKRALIALREFESNSLLPK